MYLADVLLFPHISADVTPRKKHKKDKHKSGDEDHQGSVWVCLQMRACKTIDCNDAMLCSKSSSSGRNELF